MARRARKETPITIEYKKARAALRRRVSRAKKKGYDVSGFEIPKIPKKITAGSARRLRKLGKKFGEMRQTGQLPMKPAVVSTVPTYDDRLAELADNMILTAQYWVDKHPLKGMAEMNEARIRHRGELVRTDWINSGLTFDDIKRAIASENLRKKWPDLIERLERFLFDSDQYGYDGDLTELADIFIQLTFNTDVEFLDTLQKKKLGNDIEEYTSQTEWYDHFTEDMMED